MTQLKAGLLPVILPVVASKWISAPLQGVHVVQVLSPLPRFVNPGFTAWSNAGGSQLVFVMRCNPQVGWDMPQQLAAPPTNMLIAMHQRQLRCSAVFKCCSEHPSSNMSVQLAVF